jgi:serralysin
MAHRFVTGIDTDGEILGENDSLTVLTGGAITVATAGRHGILSIGVGAKATVFGDIAADQDGIRLEGSGSSAFIGQSGNVMGGRFGLSLGSSTALEISLRNDGTITGYNGGVRLEGSRLDLVNTGTISVPLPSLGDSIASVAIASSANGSSYLTNTGSIIAGGHTSNHKAIIGGLGSDIVSNSGLIRGMVDLGAGDDRYNGQEGQVEFGNISLGTGRDIAYGGSGSEGFELDQEGDRLDDFIDGGAGVDDLHLHDGAADINVDLRLTNWQDTGVGGLTLRNVENIRTSEGHDRVTGSATDNEIATWGGNDTLEGGLGDDTLNGGFGNDTALFSGPIGATVDLRLTRSQNTGYGYDILHGIETLMGGAGDDRFIGDAAANFLSGSGGNDILQGGGGNDTLDGGAGADTAVFSGAKAGYRITQNGSNVTVEGADGTDVVRDVRFLKFDDGVTALTNAAPANLGLSSQAIVENAPRGSVVATLSAFDADGDAITYSLAGGSPFAIVGNSLVVEGALDFEATRQHNVVIQAKDNYGGVSSQTFAITIGNAVEATPFVLRGGAGADVFQGEAGNNTLYGGAGRDVLSGGGGKDVFVFNTGTGRTNVDTITDFVVRDDSIWLDNAIFKALGSKGSLSKPQKLASDAFTAATRAQDREDRIVYDKKSGKLYYDQDGTGSKAQVQIATLSKGLKMTAADFFVI